MALSTIALIKERFQPSLDASSDAALTTALASAAAWINRRTGRTIEKASYVEFFDGGCESVMLRAGRQPVIHTGSTLVTIEDSGQSLTPAIGYSETADIILRNVNEDRAAEVIYNWGRFTGGVQNVKVSYTAGWTLQATGDEIELPVDISELAKEVAWLIFASKQWVGKATQTEPRGSVSWEAELSPAHKALIDRLTVN